ncbi:MAG: hypothetical protein ACI4PX_03255 [Ruminococcus sp.]
MRKYLTEYLIYIEKRIETCQQTELENILREHLDKIQFMQHERLIHFLVTMLFAFMFFMSLGIFMLTDKISLIPLMILILCLIVPYIRHYYFLENNVQKMYYIYDKILEKTEKK